MSLTPEQDLVGRAQDGDTEAFAELVLTHQQFAFNVALRALNNRQDAEDLVQEAFIRSWKSLPGFRSEASFRTWLYRIVINLCYNRLPKLKREISALDQEHDLINLKTADREREPEVFLEGKQMADYLQRRIEDLPDRYRIILMLRYQGDCSYQEIANILDLPMGTVKTSIHRARQSLKETVINTQGEWVRL